MDQKRPHTGGMRDMDGAEDRIPEESAAEALALPALIDGEPSEHDYGDGIGHVSPDSSGRSRLQGGAGGQGVISDDTSANANHIGAAGSALFISQRTLPEPFVEDRYTGIEPARIVRWA